jgi:hypothetical protein
MLSERQAVTIRRTLWASAALAATLGANVAATGGELHMLPSAPLVWLVLIASVALAAPPRGRFEAQTPLVTLGRLIGAQMVLHVAMTISPWVFGLTPHHRESLVAPAALLAHLAAALLLGAALHLADRLLAGAVAIVRVMRGLMSRPLPRPTPRLGVIRTFWRPAPGAVIGVASCRGPPAVGAPSP